MNLDCYTYNSSLVEAVVIRNIFSFSVKVFEENSSCLRFTLHIFLSSIVVGLRFF